MARTPPPWSASPQLGSTSSLPSTGNSPNVASLAGYHFGVEQKASVAAAASGHSSPWQPVSVPVVVESSRPLTPRRSSTPVRYSTPIAGDQLCQTMPAPRQFSTAVSDNDQALHKRVAALELRQGLLLGPQREQSGIKAIDAEVEGLWRMLEKLQKQQDDLANALHRSLEEKFGVLEVDISDLRQNLLVERKSPGVTDALDYADDQVRDLRSSLEQMILVQDRQEANASDLQVACSKLFEQLKELQVSQSNQKVEVSKLTAISKLSGGHVGALRTQVENLEPLRSQVETLETKLVADLESKLVSELTRNARQECDNERAFQSLQSRIDALETQQTFLSKLDDTQACAHDPLLDLQAVVDRQLAEEHAKSGTATVRKESGNASTEDPDVLLIGWKAETKVASSYERIG